MESKAVFVFFSWLNRLVESYPPPTHRDVAADAGRAIWWILRSGGGATEKKNDVFFHGLVDQHAPRATYKNHPK